MVYMEEKTKVLPEAKMNTKLKSQRSFDLILLSLVGEEIRISVDASELADTINVLSKSYFIEIVRGESNDREESV